MNSIWGRRVAINRSSSAASLSPTLGRARFLTHCERARVEWQQLRTLAMYKRCGAVNARRVVCCGDMQPGAGRQIRTAERSLKTAPAIPLIVAGASSERLKCNTGVEQMHTGHRLMDRDLIGCIFYCVYPLIQMTFAIQLK